MRPEQHPVPGKARSGQHPAVKAYRAKIDSIDEHVSVATNALDQALAEFLADLKTPLPPNPDAANAAIKAPSGSGTQAPASAKVPPKPSRR